MASLIGALKSARKIKLPCGGEECQLHDTYDVREVISIQAGAPLEIAREVEEYQEWLREGLLVESEVKAYPTMLGLWYQDVSEN